MQFIDKFGVTISNFNEMCQCASFMRNSEACCKETGGKQNCFTGYHYLVLWQLHQYYS